MLDLSRLGTAGDESASLLIRWSAGGAAINYSSRGDSPFGSPRGAAINSAGRPN